MHVPVYIFCTRRPGSELTISNQGLRLLARSTQQATIANYSIVYPATSVTEQNVDDIFDYVTDDVIPELMMIEINGTETDDNYLENNVTKSVEESRKCGSQ